MSEVDEVYSLLKSQDKRIKKLEKIIAANMIDTKGDMFEGEESTKVIPKIAERKSEPGFFSKLTFIQVITFLGILGIVIGAISFFFYAVANNWIGETLQILIGVLVGFVLFGFGYFLRRDNENWSNMVIGGAFFVEYLSVGVGVLGYKVLPASVGVGLSVLFLASSIVFSIIFKSRVIGYFSLIGGYTIPFITGTHSYNLFMMVFFSLLSLGLVVLSFRESWTDLRFTSFIFMAGYLFSQVQGFSRMESKMIPLSFLIIVFVLYHVASLVGAVRKLTDKMSVLDSIVIAAFPVLFLFILHELFEWSQMAFGFFVIIFSFIYLVEIFVFKTSGTDLDKSVLYSLLSTGIIIFNFGLVFLFDAIDLSYLSIVFVIEYILFSVISKDSEEKTLYKVFSMAALLLIAVWFFLISDFSKVPSAILNLIVYLVAVVSFYILGDKNIFNKVNKVAFIVGGYMYLFGVYRFLTLIISSGEANQIILSIMWLIYTLVLFYSVESKGSRWLVIVLIAVTLAKIAFRDLFYLDGVFRIIGFIIFGVLLLIGGYVLNKNGK